MPAIHTSTGYDIPLSCVEFAEVLYNRPQRVAIEGEQDVLELAIGPTGGSPLEVSVANGVHLIVLRESMLPCVIDLVHRGVFRSSAQASTLLAKCGDQFYRVCIKPKSAADSSAIIALAEHRDDFLIGAARPSPLRDDD